MQCRATRPRRRLLLVLTLALGAGCAGVHVSRDFDDTYDFAPLHSYNFLDPTPERTGMDAATLATIQQAIDAKLHKKGFEKSEQPQFGVAVRGGRETQTDREGYRYDWSERDSSALQAFQYDVGSLVIEMVDLQSQSLIWRSAGSAVIGRDDPKSSARRIEAAVEKMLSPFPPGR